jgi:hypothetical protein
MAHPIDGTRQLIAFEKDLFLLSHGKKKPLGSPGGLMKACANCR